MVRITAADFETISAECPHCASAAIYNRMTDIGASGPYAGRNITCLTCSKEFWISMDTVSEAYEMFIWATDEHFKMKRYMLVAAALAQAWELFFTAFARSTFVYRPLFAEDRAFDTLAFFNALAARLDKVIDTWTFFPLRNLLIRSVIEGLRPTSRAEAESAISRLESGTFGNDVSPSVLSGIQPSESQEVIKGLLDLKIGKLRNAVVHKRAYRPLRSEVEPCLEDEVQFLYHVAHALDVGSFDEFAAGVM
jgi:hypothetical protein